MIQLAASMLVIIATFAAIAALAAIGAAFARKWSIFRKCVLAVVLAALGLISTFGLLMFGAASLAAGGTPAGNATLVAKGISEGMNLAAVALAILLVAIPCWLVAKRRARRAEPRQDA